MSPERWEQVEELFHAALAQEPGQRAAFLVRASKGDEELRCEVERLLAQNGSLEDRIEHPAWEGADVASKSSALAPGVQLGPYRIEGLLGAGGMGQVYKACDTRLGRMVAIKVVAEEFSNRIEREGRAISGLNHPHICTLYDVGPGYLVMELVEGETLASRLKRGRLPMDAVLRYGAEIADALAAAHAKGIIHRDLKPGNLMVTKSGIKVLDFGLARIVQPDETMTASHMVQGTPAYMAPEQLEGKRCDARTDIYSLGLVLYEMAIGKRLKQGETANLQNLPERLRHVVDLCLKPDPDERWQSARDVRSELGWAGESRPAAEARQRRPAWMALAALALILSSFVAWRAMQPGPRIPEQALRVTVSAPPGTRLFARRDEATTISPDGKLLAILATQEDSSSVWVRRMDTGEVKRLDGTRGAFNIFWSPDSRHLAFFADQKLKRVSADGGPVELICDAPTGRGGTWSRAGVIVFSPNIGSVLHRVADSGGVSQPITQLDSTRREDAHYWPQFLPDGNRFLYLARSLDPQRSAIRVASLEPGFGVPVVTTSRVKASLSQGYLLLVRDGLLVAQEFDSVRAELTGEPQPLATGVAFSSSYGPAAFSTSETGILTYTSAPGNHLVWVNRQGHELERIGMPGDHRAVVIGPDGNSAAIQSVDPMRGIHNVRLLDFARGTRSSFTQRATNVWYPAWSRSGEVIVFGSDHPAPANLYRQEVGSNRPEELLLPAAGLARFPNDWSPDGRYLIYQEGAPVNAKAALWLLPFPRGPTGPPSQPVRFLGAEHHTAEARISPDGRHVAYVSAETGVKEVFIQTFPTPSRRIQISQSGATQPRWRRDGKELFYVAPRSTLMAVPIARSGDVIEPGKAGALFRHEGLSIDGLMDYDVAPDGLRFLTTARAEDSADAIQVVVNWPLAIRPRE